jgi:hypothetical protein
MMSSTKPSEKGTMQRTEMHSGDLPENLRKAAKTSTGSTLPGALSILKAASFLVHPGRMRQCFVVHKVKAGVFLKSAKTQHCYSISRALK